MPDDEKPPNFDKPIEPLDKDAIHDLARRIVKREVFFTNNPEMMADSFPIILLMTPEQFDSVGQFGGVWAEMEKASPTAINGWPMFFSCRFVHQESIEPLMDEIVRLEDLLESKPK